MDAAQIFNLPINGRLSVCIQGVGEMNIDGIGEPIRMLISTVETCLSGEITVCDMNDDVPYTLVSFDENLPRIVVAKRRNK